MSPYDLTDLIGIPFLSKGRDPLVGLDCWGMAMMTFRRFGHEVPDFDVACDDALKIGRNFNDELSSGRWTRIEEPEPGCGVAMAIDLRMPDFVQHFGVYVGGGKVIHTLRKVSSCTFSIHDSFWSRRVKGYYRWMDR